MSPSLAVGVAQFQIQGQQVVPPALQVDYPHGANRPLDREPCGHGDFPYSHSHKTAPIVHPFIGDSQRRIGLRCLTDVDLVRLRGRVQSALQSALHVHDTTRGDWT